MGVQKPLLPLLLILISAFLPLQLTLESTIQGSFQGENYCKYLNGIHLRSEK